MMIKTNSHKMLKHALWLLMEHDIFRYLISNTAGREDGAEKAERHDRLCSIYLAILFSCEIDYVRANHMEEWEVVHTHTQELTGYMDKEIGFPIDSYPDYDVLAPKFFRKFIRLARESLEIHESKEEIK